MWAERPSCWRRSDFSAKLGHDGEVIAPGSHRFCSTNEVDYGAMFQFGGLGPGDGQKMGLWVEAAWQQTLPNAPMIDAVGTHALPPIYR